MKKIYKHTLNPAAQDVQMTGLVKVLSVMGQEDDVVLYALIDLESPLTTRLDYRIYNTDQEVEDSVIEGYRFLGTVNLAGGSLMYHVYVNDRDIVQEYGY